MTNTEKIRSMTDEGLAEFIREYIDCLYCPITNGNPCACDDKECLQAIMDWLKQPAEE